MMKQTTTRHRIKAPTAPLFLLVATILLASAAIAAEPRLTPFEARPTDANGADLTGVHTVSFVIYDEPTGGQLHDNHD